MRPDTTIYLNENNITALSEESFRPMLDILSMGDGVLDLSDNLIQCDCEISWLMLGRKYLRNLSGKCNNGTELKDFDSSSLNACPRECPYQCINNLWISLCTPGTVTLSHVDNCRSGELCCQLNIPKTTTMTSSSVPDILFVCGRKNYQVTLSKGGKPSQIGEWSWQVAIYDVQEQDIVCGGALIQEQWVLTAAHCVSIQGTDRPRTKKDLLVYLGKQHRANVEDDEYVQIRQVAGWGFDGSDLPTPVLTDVQLPVISNSLCRRDTAYFTGDITATRTLTSNMFCADNLIQCDCEISWLMLRRKYLRNLSGKCNNGTELKDFDSNSLNACPRDCPYQCINNLWISLCTPGTVTLSHVDNCRSGELCCQLNIRETTTTTSSSVPGILFVCGRKNYQVTLSKGGKPSHIGQWPWQAAIYDVQEQDIVCGGALIQEQWVLTAAHCVSIQGTDRPRTKKDLLVYLGKQHRANVEDDEYVQIRQV
ncbi:unnamed protein product [Darwinula stevensoni]|uniref:Peptidase S1 domain-containing protein n=1 Tax=Darwinula stevensoni TaxID=69355 RepID=A0A7R8X935_9CRUS|nr:unnamed protein product [Darwinula stevensoni]CAG0890745.1 unnamed protein product [Darwinula stevensoni]